MGLNFHVQLLIKGPSSEEVSVVRMPCLGNAAIRRAISPLMETHEFHGEQCIPSQGEMSFMPDTPAYLAVRRLHDDLKRRLDDARRERRELHEHPELGDWSVAHEYIIHSEPFVELLDNSMRAADSIDNNDHCSARIVWC
tara:strand:- start:40 stop:459 length:420 start_codon:yes stop_codon:yes gene_type:complete